MVAGMGLCCRFVLETMLLTLGCFSEAEQCLHRANASSAPHTELAVSGLGVHKELEGDTAGTADPTYQKDIPYHMASKHIPLREDGGREGRLESWHLSSQVTVTSDGALLSWEQLDT